MLRSAVCAFVVIFVVGCAGSLTRLSEADKRIHATALIPHQSQQQLLVGTRIWMESQFTERPDSVTYDDNAGGVVSAVGRIDYDCAWLECLSKGDWQVYFSMRVTANDGEIQTLFQRIRLVAPAADANASGAMNSPLWSQRDLDNIRPALLDLNRKLEHFLRQRG